MMINPFSAVPAAREYTVLAVRFEPDHAEERRVYVATSIGEALTMAERADAGRASYVYGVTPADYAEARGEGIAFNEADGLLIDDPDVCRECGTDLTWSDIEAQDRLCADCARLEAAAERSRGEDVRR